MQVIGCRFFAPIVIFGAVMGSLFASYEVLKYANQSPQGSVQRDFLINMAAGLVEIAIGTALTVLLAFLVAKSKFLQLSRPVLELIQRLRIDGRLSPEGARRSVVFAVALLSESNVSKSILSKPTSGARNDCPICSKRVKEMMNRCSFCKLPKTIWNDKKLVVVHRNNPTNKRAD
jgi:hypothetical protein